MYIAPVTWRLLENYDASIGEIITIIKEGINHLSKAAYSPMQRFPFILQCKDFIVQGYCAAGKNERESLLWREKAVYKIFNLKKMI